MSSVISEQWKCNCYQHYISEYPPDYIRTYIFPGVGKFPFLIELSRPVHGRYFRLKEWHFRVTSSISFFSISGRKFATELSPLLPLMPTPQNLIPSAQKLFHPTAQHDLLIQFYLFLEVSSSPEQLFVLQHWFCSRKLACFWLLSVYSKFMSSSQRHIYISIHSQCSGHHCSFLMPYLAVFYIVSGEEFWVLWKNTSI